MTTSQEEKAMTKSMETVVMIPSEEVKATTKFMVTMEMTQSKETAVMTRLEATMEMTILSAVLERILYSEERMMIP